MNIGNGTVNADGDLDGTTGTIDMTNANANLVLSSTATSLGTLNAAEGTVTYDGGTQNVLAGHLQQFIHIEYRGENCTR